MSITFFCLAETLSAGDINWIVISENARMNWKSIGNQGYTLYDYACFTFWIAISVAVISILGVAIGEFIISITILSILVQNPSVDFFGNSLGLILNVFSIMFLIVIFLVQNANQNYSNRLARVIFHDQYFIGSIGFIIVASIFNLSGSYFDWGAPFTTIGFAFSISSIIIVASLIFLTGYFIDVSNIIKYLTKQYIADISPGKLYKTGFGTEYIDREYTKILTTNIQLISSTCIRAIEENNHTLAKTCLNSLITMSSQYLRETDPDEANDDFLQNLNDEFQFIGSTAFKEDIRQKYAQDVVKAVGEIGKDVTSRREIGTPGAIWGALLKRLFEDAVEFDRNKVGPIAIEKLGEMGKIAIIESDDRSFRHYEGGLKEIAGICIQRDETYFNNLVANISREYQEMYIVFLRRVCEDGWYSDYDLKGLIETYATVFIVSKASFGNMSKDTLLASIIGPMQPFTAKLAAELHRHYILPPQRQNKLIEYLSYLNQFVRNITKEVSTNKQQIYQVYTTLFYVYALYAPLGMKNRSNLLLNLNKRWIELISDTYRYNMKNGKKVDYNIEKDSCNFYAVMIYFYRYNPKIIAGFVEPLLKEYNELKADFPSGNMANDQHLERVYLQLKLIAAWIDEVNDLCQVSPKLKQVLVDDFYESDFQNLDAVGRMMHTGIEKYNYPHRKMYDSGSDWQLQPDPVWTNRFQENIADLLNGDNKHYETFHEELRARHKLKKAGQVGTVIQQITDL